MATDDHVMNQGYVSLPIRWEIPNDVKSTYAERFVIQSSDREFTIMFFDLMKPILLGDEEERRQILENTEYVSAQCVSRVHLPPEVIPELISSLEEQWEMWQQRGENESQPEEQGD